jgi:mannose-1-phosphate guanylyltransferase
VLHAPRYAVVIAGGSGTRFWPRSRAHAPKQLLTILGGRSLLQDTVARISPPIGRRHVLVVTGRPHARAVRRQLRALPRAAVLVEPVARNTAPAIALAALHLARRAPHAVMAVLPADHAISNLPAFRRDLGLALTVAERSGALVTLGVAPTHAETGYGYIRTGRPLPGTRGRAAEVAAFIEKPDRARAEALLAGGGVLWNSGIFAWRVDTILAALRAHLPEVMRPLEKAGGRGLAAAYRRLPSISIDHGVMERADRVAVVRARFTWSDVGSWAAVAALWAGGNGPNALRGRALPIDSRGCLIDSPERLVAVLGVDDLVVVDTPDAVLVCRKDRAQDVRLIVEELRRRGLRQYL